MIGELVDHYRVVEIVGRGGMGMVYKAEDVNLDRTVALKVLSSELREDPDFIRRFRQEARVQAALNHQNVATLYDFLVWNGSPVAVMEFIEGETFQSMMARCGPLPAHIALPIFTQALRGVAAGHRRGIVHRDLKPANLMINEEGVVKVTDFGIAKVQNSSSHTQASTRVGSSSYMSPEQILGRAVDARTDIYALGVTLYEMLCGRPPFQAKAVFEIESAHVRDVPAPPTQYYPHIPPAAVAAVMRALAKDPADRFANTEEFIQALPDMRGMPYVDPGGSGAPLPATVAADATTVRPRQAAPYRDPGGASAPLPVTAAVDATTVRPRQAMPHVDPGDSAAPLPAATTPDATKLPPQPVRARARGMHILGGVLVALLAAVGVYWLAGGRAPKPAAVATTRLSPQSIAPAPPVVPAHPTSAPQQPTSSPVPETTASLPARPRPSERPPERRPAALVPGKSLPASLSGLWTGTYADGAGRSQLRVLALQMSQVADGSITGSLIYRSENGAAEKCSLEHSNYSLEKKRLRLIVHCAGATRPKYLNVPLDFVEVDPGARALAGGRLAFHLADDIVVNLRRGAE